MPDVHLEPPSNFNSASTENHTYRSNASYLPPSSDGYGARQSFFSADVDPSSRPTTYNQLLDYLDTLSVKLIDPADLTIGRPIGCGATFYVEEGRLVNHSSRSMLVAVKTPRENIHKDRIVLSAIIQEVLDEIRVMSFLSLHPNVVSIIGVVLERSSNILLPRLVVEHAVGSLGYILRASSSRSGGVPLSLKLRFLLEIAAGLEALHLLEVVHGDVKADNILVIYSCSNWGLSAVAPMLVAKVSDFGFCVPDTSSRDVYVASRGTFRFKAPEALPEAPPSLHRHINLPQRDVYSYGVMLSEIMNDGVIPFRDFEDEKVVHLQLSSEDGAANQLITSGVFGVQGALQANQRICGALITLIKSTVCRDPMKRISWQEVFQIVCAVCEGLPSPDRHSTFKEYFTTHSHRQRQTSWNVFQSHGSYLPTIPFPISTDDNAFTILMLRELQEASHQPHDWISAIRLALHFYVHGDVVEMSATLQRFLDADLNVRGDYSNGLLHLAVRTDAVEVMHALLLKGADVDALDIEGRAPLHIVRSAAAARMLIEFGANVNILNRYTPLHFCRSADIADVLIDSGADIDAKGVSGATPLHTAQSVEVISVLLHHGANPLTGDSDGRTPLHCTVSDVIASFLIRHCPLAVKALDRHRRSPLHDGLTYWNGQTVRLAISHGADVNTLSSYGKSALFESQHSRFVSCRTNSVDAVAALISAGTAIPAPQGVDSSPLHETLSPTVMELLLQNGYKDYVNWHRRVLVYHGSGSDTPLHVVSARDVSIFWLWLTTRDRKEPQRRRRGIFLSSERLELDEGTKHLLQYSLSIPSSRLMKVLLDHDADPNIRDSNMDTPLHLVARNWIGYSGHSENVALIRVLLQSGADIHSRNAFDETPLHCAARPETVLALLDAGADPTLTDKEGVTILHNAFRFADDYEKIVKALISHGADVNAHDDMGFTPLHYACRTYESDSPRHGLAQVKRWMQYIKLTQGEVYLALELLPIFENAAKVVKVLLDYGANINARSKLGDTALGLASRHVFGRDVFRLLCSRGADGCLNYEFVYCTRQSAVVDMNPWWDFD